MVALPRTCRHCGSKMMHYGACDCPAATIEWVAGQREYLQRKAAELDKIEATARREQEAAQSAE